MVGYHDFHGTPLKYLSSGTLMRARNLTLIRLNSYSLSLVLKLIIVQSYPDVLQVFVKIHSNVI